MNFEVIEGMTVESYFNRAYTPTHRSSHCSEKVPDRFNYKFSEDVVLNMSVSKGRIAISSASEKMAATIKSKNASILKSSKTGETPGWKVISLYGIKEDYLNVEVGDKYQVNLYYERADCSCPVNIWQ